MEQTGWPQPPTGWRRVLFRLPVLLYRAHLGALLGRRFVLIHHVGRSSGLPRRAVVEVVALDAGTGSVTVASGFGPRSQWYRNLVAEPDVEIEVGSHRQAVHATRLSPAQATDVMLGYARRHPRAARRLSRFMGFRVDGSDEDYRAMGTQVPMLRFDPRR